MIVNLKKYLTIIQAARRRDLTEERVKEIRAIKIGKWHIKPEDMEAAG